MGSNARRGKLTFFDAEGPREQGLLKHVGLRVSDLAQARAALPEGTPEVFDIGEGILEVEPFPRGFVFMATCVCTGKVEGIFAKGEEKAETAAIRKSFDGMNEFVRCHRVRRADDVPAVEPVDTTEVDAE